MGHCFSKKKTRDANHQNDAARNEDNATTMTQVKCQNDLPPPYEPAQSTSYRFNPIQKSQALPWKSGKVYIASDIVEYNGTLYSCSIAHKSLDMWDPVAAQALWDRLF